MQKTIVVYTDDLTGEEYRPSSGQTVTFALRGVEYEIDLTNDHAHELENFLTRYMRQGRRVKQLAVRGHRAKVIDMGAKEQREKVREWARERGMEVAKAGAIPKTVMIRYNEEAGVAS
jgi:hypothetical protein